MLNLKKKGLYVDDEKVILGLEDETPTKYIVETIEDPAMTDIYLAMWNASHIECMKCLDNSTTVEESTKDVLLVEEEFGKKLPVEVEIIDPLNVDRVTTETKIMGIKMRHEICVHEIDDIGEISIEMVKIEVENEITIFFVKDGVVATRREENDMWREVTTRKINFKLSCNILPILLIFG